MRWTSTRRRRLSRYYKGKPRDECQAWEICAAQEDLRSSNYEHDAEKKRMHDQVVLMFRREKKDCDVFDYIIFNTTQLKIISKQNEEKKMWENSAFPTGQQRSGTYHLVFCANFFFYLYNQKKIWPNTFWLNPVKMIIWQHLPPLHTHKQTRKEKNHGDKPSLSSFLPSRPAPPWSPLTPQNQLTRRSTLIPVFRKP